MTLVLFLESFNEETKLSLKASQKLTVIEFNIPSKNNYNQGILQLPRRK